MLFQRRKNKVTGGNGMRLYILIDEQYDPSYRGVQGAHAVAAYLLQNPESSWKNQTLVFLKIDNIDHWKHKLRMKQKPFTEFIEPNVGHKTTALAVLDEIGNERMFRHLELS